MPPATLRLLAHAKVNLTLEVLGKRDDGFHALRSILLPLALADRLELTVGLRSDRLEVPGLPELEGPDNLALRAVVAFRARFGVSGVGLRLDKRIPLAAGLGGGSSDAAAVLVGLARWKGVPLAALAPLAEALGSDVPFFLRERTALATGRGEILSPVTPPPTLFLLLVKPAFGISARAAYGAWRELTLTHSHGNASSQRLGSSYRQSMRTARDAAKLLRNDLQPGCEGLHPELTSLLRRLDGLGALGVLMSGSGSTCFAVFGSRVALRAAMNRFQPRPSEIVIATRSLRSVRRRTSMATAPLRATS